MAAKRQIHLRAQGSAPRMLTAYPREHRTSLARPLSFLLGWCHGCFPGFRLNELRRSARANGHFNKSQAILGFHMRHCLDERLLESVRCGHAPCPGAARFGDFREIRTGRKIGQRNGVGLGGMAIGIDVENRLTNCAPLGVVQYQDDHRESKCFGNLVAGTGLENM